MDSISPDSDGLARKCGECRLGEEFEIPFTMAFQPVINLETQRVYAYEALVRGPQNESAYSILSQITPQNRYGFDQACRVRAIELAARLGLPATGASLSINFLPNAVYNPRACISTTLRTAKRVDFPLDRLIFEITETEEIVDHKHLSAIVAEYRAMGFRTAIDDFGAGYSGLTLLARFQPDVIKLDMELVRGIDDNPVRRSIVDSILKICRELSLTVVAEGVETEGECQTLWDLGVRLYQGYLFAKPAFEALPSPHYPTMHTAQPEMRLAAAG